ncbi:MAG: BTAD domain-containing putative transcriptional regulator [Armatimonadetes bacterium]|nr:BTAD domain-containing putative transcriptional regulator [Armatimonadota bacterium]
MVAHLWPDSSEIQGRQSLRQILADLRTALGSQSYRLTSPTTQTLLFDAHGAEIDVLRFDALLHTPTPSLPALEEAITLYRGPLMEGSMEPLFMQEQDIRRQAFLEAVGAYADKVLSREVGVKAISYLKRGILEDPLRESLYRSLMQLYAEEGDFAATVQTYRDLRVRLQEDLSASPEPETTALYQSLRAKARAKLQQEPASLGKPSVASEKPIYKVPLASTSAIPRPIMGLIGREKEVAEVKEFTCKSPVTTLLGMGGVGKTRLSIQVARDLAEQRLEVFEDGVYFVPLAAINDPTFLLQTIASALGVRETLEESLFDTLKSYLRSRALLLVLDNCEHLVTDCANIAETLLGDAVGLHILATSREPLGITGEICYRLQPLAYPTAQHAFEEYEVSPSVRLFVERAALVQPHFRLTPKNAEQVATICRRLDGIPLALELAAARLKMLSLDQIIARLEDRFSLLTGGSRTALPRHQTLRALIDGSYELLSEEEREVFCALSVFQGSFTLTSAEAICNDEETLFLFSHLVDRSLITAEESGFGERRYRLLESLREYAAERLKERGEKECIEGRFVQWAVGWLDATSRKMLPKARMEWLKRIDAEYENLRKALLIAPPGELKGCLAGGLDRYWYSRSFAKEAERWLLSAMEGYGSMTEATQTQLQVALGMAYWQKADNISARKCLLEALRLARKTGKHLLNSAVALGLVEAADRNHILALEYYTEGLEVSRQERNTHVQATVLSNMACLYLDRDEFEQARSLFYQSREVWQEIGDQRGVVFEDLFLALVEERTGNDQGAYEQYVSCLEQLHALDDDNGIVWGLAFLTYVQMKRGRYLFSAKLAGALEGLRERLGINANPTQVKAEVESRNISIEALGEPSYLSAFQEGCSWDMKATITYIRSSEGA